MAAGKPIVSVNQGTDYEFSEFINVADDYKSFLSEIERELATRNSYELIQKRKNIAKENSWQSRVEEIVVIIEKNLFEKQLDKKNDYITVDKETSDVY